MKKKQMNKHVLKHVSKCTAVFVLAFTMLLQLCFSFTVLAYGRDYSYGYPYWDELYDGYSGSGYDDSGRRLTNVTRTYDDGTTYTSAYRYDEQGNLISVNIKETDGSKVTMTRTYRGEALASETTYEYDASDKSEETGAIDYGEDGYPAHILRKYKYSDGTSESEETWYVSQTKPQKYIAVSVDGTTIQIDFTYNEKGQEHTRVTSSSDGSVKQEERQYNEFGEEIQYKMDEYDAAMQEKNTIEMRIEGEGESQVKYIVETKALSDGSVYKEEGWVRTVDEQIIKSVTTSPDGSQSIANYTYNADGKETLYTKSNHDGTTEKRETFYTKTGTETVYTDGRGSSTRTSVSYDSKNGQNVREETVNHADGSSSYKKRVYDDYYSSVYYLYKEKEADGTETYTEKTYKSDGSGTEKEKAADGTVTETEIDAEGNTVGRHKTLPDGTKSETSWTWQADGQVTSEVTRYTDGTEDRIDYEYDESGVLVKQTETRRNGVSAVMLVQYNETNKYTGTQTITFNNGYQVTYTSEDIDSDTVQTVFTYSAGDVYQDFIVEKGSESIYLKTVYRDGRIEEASLNLGNYEEYYKQYEKLTAMSERYSSFLEQAWSILPTQAPTAAEATPSAV